MAQPGVQTADFGQLGPSSAGEHILSPWFEGSWPITQGWGPSSVSLEPEGHGYAHWHAGVDVGLDCGTTIMLPGDFASAGYAAQAVYLDNPGGYGTGLIVKVSVASQPQYSSKPGGHFNTNAKRLVDIYLGHLRTRTVPDGSQINSGQPIAISNNTGNSTGCHLHFEVRPPDGRYGTDIDPASWLLYGAATQALGQVVTADQNPYNPFTEPEQWLEWQLVHDIEKPLKAVGNEVLGLAQTGLGAVMMLGGTVMIGAGMRGMSAGQLGAAARRTFSAPGRRQDNLAPAQQQPEKVTEPGEATTPLPEAQPVSPQAQSAIDEARSGRGRRLSPEVREELRRQRTPAQRMQARRSRVRLSHQGRMPMPQSGRAQSPRRGR